MRLIAINVVHNNESILIISAVNMQCIHDYTKICVCLCVCLCVCVCLFVRSRTCCYWRTGALQ